MAFQLTIEQVSFPSESYSTICSSVDSLNSVVDANIDFTPMACAKNEVVLENKGAVKENHSSDDLCATAETENQFGAILHVSSGNDINENNACGEREPQQMSLNEANLAFSYDSMAASYPEIPLPVAQFINKNNPEWFAAEKYVKFTNSSESFSEAINYSSHAPKVSLSSPLESMAASSEALALQHSVIGSREVKPVSPDVVAEVVARTRLRLSGLDPSNTDFTSSLYGKQNMSSNSEVLKVFTSSKLSESRRSSCSSVSSKSPKRGARERDMPLVHVSKLSSAKSADHQNYSKYLTAKEKIAHVKLIDCIPDSETESCFSERFELESLCSEAFESESSMSDVSGLDDEVFRVRKFLMDSKTTIDGPHQMQVSDISSMPPESKLSVSMLNLPNFEEKIPKKDQSTETESTESFELMRAKANLEGRLESVAKNEMDLSKECASLKALVISLQADVEALTKQCDLAVAEKQKVLRELDFEKKQQDKWDGVLKEYQSIIECKTSEVKALKEDVSESERANTQVRMKLEELKVDMELKDGSITGLKKKIAELHVEVQVLLQNKVQLENEVKSIKHEMDTLHKSKAWYQDQLRSTQESRNKLHQDLIALQSEHVSLSNSMEKSKTEISHLKQQLNDVQHRAVAEKEILMKHLETIEADMMERESLFEEIQKDKGSVESAFLERAKRMEEERSKLTNLMFSVSDLEYQLNVTKSEMSEKDKALSDLEREKIDLTKQLTFLQKSITDKGLQIQQLEQSLDDANSKIRHVEASLSSAEGLISKLKNEKTASDVALASANEEKRIINESLKVLKENLNHVENNFKKMRTDLVAKSSRMEQLIKEKVALEQALAKAEEKVLHQQTNFEQQMSKNSQNSDKLVGHLKKQKSDIENVLDVYSKDLLVYQQTIQQLEKEKADLCNEIIRLRCSEKSLQDQLSSMDKENQTLHDQILILNESLSTGLFKTGHDGPANCPAFESDSFSVKKLESEKVRKYRSNIKLLLRKLKEKMKECKDLKNEVKELNEIRNSNLTADRPDLLESSRSKENDFDENRCLQLEGELNELKKLLEEERNRVEQNQKVIVELEKEKGKISAISDNNETLKQRILELENALSEKGTLASQLACKLKMVEEQLEERSQSSQSKLARLEEDLNKEKTVVKNLRRQVFDEKRNSSHLSRQLNTLKSALEQANQIADSRKAELVSLQTEIEQKIQGELKHKSEVEQLKTEIHLHKSEIESLKKEFEEMQARDPALAEQIKSLSWHLKEKNNEITALGEKQIYLEERHKSQVSDLENTIVSLQKEIEAYRTELEAIRKEKFRYQSQFAQLRKVLGSKLRNSKLPKINSDSGNSGVPSKASLDSDEQSGFDESYVNSLLQRSFRPTESRPLSHLQACLNSLKNEMAILQQHLCDNEGAE